MRTFRTSLALLLTAGVVAVSTTASAAPAETTDVADFDGTVDIWAGLNYVNDEGDQPLELEALDVVVGAGPELTAADEVANPSNWCGDLAVDIDPVTWVIVVTADDQPCDFTHVDVRIDSAELEGVVLLTNDMAGSGGADATAEVTATLVPGQGAELSWRAAEGQDDFWTSGTTVFGYLTAASFVDVDASGPFAWHVATLAAAGVTSGYDDGTFAPLAPVSRQAMATFLFRALGEQDYVAPAVSPFVDVPTSSPFYAAVSWLAESGISTGTPTPDGVAFRPTDSVSRQAMAAFLYRAVDPEGFTAPEVSPFADVPTTSAFYTEVAWLAQEGVSVGTVTEGGTLFRPAGAVSRQAMAAFLVRSGVVPSAAVAPTASAPAAPAQAPAAPAGNGDR